MQTIAIDGQAATSANVEAGHYPFWAYEHMYTLGNTSGATAAYLDFMLTSTVQQLAQKLGYIPTTNMRLSPVGSSNNKTSSSILLAFHESEASRREFF